LPQVTTTDRNGGTLWRHQEPQPENRRLYAASIFSAATTVRRDKVSKLMFYHGYRPSFMGYLMQMKIDCLIDYKV